MTIYYARGRRPTITWEEDARAIQRALHLTHFLLVLHRERATRLLVLLKQKNRNKKSRENQSERLSQWKKFNVLNERKDRTQTEEWKTIASGQFQKKKNWKDEKKTKIRRRNRREEKKRRRKSLTRHEFISTCLFYILFKYMLSGRIVWHCSDLVCYRRPLNLLKVLIKAFNNYTQHSTEMGRPNGRTDRLAWFLTLALALFPAAN